MPRFIPWIWRLQTRATVRLFTGEHVFDLRDPDVRRNPAHRVFRELDGVAGGAARAGGRLAPRAHVLALLLSSPESNDRDHTARPERQRRPRLCRDASQR